MTEARAETALLTAADLLRLDGSGVRGELIEGVFCETMSAGQMHGAIVMRLGARLVDFVAPTGLGTVVGSDSGVLLERDPDTVREPDIAFTSARRLAVGQEVAGYAEVVPDLVVEVASPSERRGATHDKARMWLSFGVRLVWVIYPESRSARVHRLDGPVELLAPDASLDGHDVLPGFSCPLAQIFADAGDSGNAPTS